MTFYCSKITKLQVIPGRSSALVTAAMQAVITHDIIPEWRHLHHVSAHFVTSDVFWECLGGCAGVADDNVLPTYSREQKKNLKTQHFWVLMNCGTPLWRSLSRDTKHKWAIEHR